MVAEDLTGGNDEGYELPRRLFDMTQGGDHQIAHLLLLAGQTGALPGGRASLSAISQMIYPASSQFVPDPALIDLAINKGKGIEQHIHHGGWEAYSAGTGYVISAGGVSAGFAYPALLGPIDIPPNIVPRDETNNDRGAALPTVLIPNGGPLSGQTRVDFLRIDGETQSYGVGDGKTSWTHDHNLCVSHGFACGTAIQIPGPLKEAGCLSGPGGPFQFLDSRTCPATRDGPRFFVALFIQNCASGAHDCVDNFGFFEAADAAADNEDIAAFRDRVIHANPAVITDLSKMRGTYVTSRNVTIAFDARGHQDDDEHSGIVSVDNVKPPDLDDWHLAEGDAIESTGDGVIRVHNRRWKLRVTLDFSDESHPLPVKVELE